MSETDRPLLRQNSKSSSENLSNHYKDLCFCCLQDKACIKMPKWIIFLILSKVFVLITELFDIINDDSFLTFLTPAHGI